MSKSKSIIRGIPKRKSGHFFAHKDDAVQWFQREGFEPAEFISLLSSERELDQARNELTHLNEYCKQEVQNVVHTHHKDFLEASRDVQDVEVLVDELRNYVSGSVAVVANLVDLPSLPKQVAASSGLSADGLHGQQQSSPWESILTQQADLMQELQVAVAERDVSMARALLNAARDMITIVDRDAAQLGPQAHGDSLPGWRYAFECALAAQKAALIGELQRQLLQTNSSTWERRQAAQNLGLVVGPSQATLALLGCHTQRVRKAQQHLLKQHSAGLDVLHNRTATGQLAGGDPDGIEYAGGLAQRTFLAIGGAVEDIRALFPSPASSYGLQDSHRTANTAAAQTRGTPDGGVQVADVLPQLSALVVQWASEEAQHCAALLCRHALTPFVTTGSVVGALLCVGLALVFCVALETSHSLALRVDFMHELWPLLEGIIRRHIYRLREVASTSATVDATNAALQAMAGGSSQVSVLPELTGPRAPMAPRAPRAQDGSTTVAFQEDLSFLLPRPNVPSASTAPAGLSCLPMLLHELRALAEGLAALSSPAAVAVLRQGVVTVVETVCEKVHGSLARLMGSTGTGEKTGTSKKAGPQGAMLAAYVSKAERVLRHFIESDLQVAAQPLESVCGPVAPPELLLPFLSSFSDLLTQLPEPAPEVAPVETGLPQTRDSSQQRLTSTARMNEIRADVEVGQNQSGQVVSPTDTVAQARDGVRIADLSARTVAVESVKVSARTGAAEKAAPVAAVPVPPLPGIVSRLPASHGLPAPTQGALEPDQPSSSSWDAPGPVEAVEEKRGTAAHLRRPAMAPEQVKLPQYEAEETIRPAGFQARRDEANAPRRARVQPQSEQESPRSEVESKQQKEHQQRHGSAQKEGERVRREVSQPEDVYQPSAMGRATVRRRNRTPHDHEPGDYASDPDDEVKAGVVPSRPDAHDESISHSRRDPPGSLLYDKFQDQLPTVEQQLFIAPRKAPSEQLARVAHRQGVRQGNQDGDEGDVLETEAGKAALDTGGRDTARSRRPPDRFVRFQQPATGTEETANLDMLAADEASIRRPRRTKATEAMGPELQQMSQQGVASGVITEAQRAASEHEGSDTELPSRWPSRTRRYKEQQPEASALEGLPPRPPYPRITNDSEATALAPALQRPPRTPRKEPRGMGDVGTAKGSGTDVDRMSPEPRRRTRVPAESTSPLQEREAPRHWNARGASAEGKEGPEKGITAGASNAALRDGRRAAVSVVSREASSGDPGTLEEVHEGLVARANVWGEADRKPLSRPATRKPNRFGVVLSDDEEGPITVPRLRRPQPTGIKAADGCEDVLGVPGMPLSRSAVPRLAAAEAEDAAAAAAVRANEPRLGQRMRAGKEKERDPEFDGAKRAFSSRRDRTAGETAAAKQEPSAAVLDSVPAAPVSTAVRIVQPSSAGTDFVTPGVAALPTSVRSEGTGRVQTARERLAARMAAKTAALDGLL